MPASYVVSLDQQIKLLKFFLKKKIDKFLPNVIREQFLSISFVDRVDSNCFAHGPLKVSL